MGKHQANMPFFRPLTLYAEPSLVLLNTAACLVQRHCQTWCFLYGVCLHQLLPSFCLFLSGQRDGCNNHMHLQEICELFLEVLYLYETALQHACLISLIFYDCNLLCRLLVLPQDSKVPCGDSLQRHDLTINMTTCTAHYTNLNLRTQFYQLRPF